MDRQRLQKPQKLKSPPTAHQDLSGMNISSLSNGVRTLDSLTRNTGKRQYMHAFISTAFVLSSNICVRTSAPTHPSFQAEYGKTYLVFLTVANHLCFPRREQTLALRQVTDGGPSGDGKRHHKKQQQQEHPRNTRNRHLGSGEAAFIKDPREMQFSVSLSVDIYCLYFLFLRECFGAPTACLKIEEKQIENNKTKSKLFLILKHFHAY